MASHILDTSDKVAKKTDMLSSLTDMKLTTKLIDAAENEDDLNELDKKFKSLNNKIQPLSSSTTEYK